MKPVLVACGVRREARIAEATGNVMAVAGGGDGEWLEGRLEALAAGAAGVMSFGLCGALKPELRVGDILVADVTAGALAAGCDEAWVAAIRRALACHPGFDTGPAFAVSDADRGEAGRTRIESGVAVWADGALARTTERKTELAATGAVFIDMESHIAARVAARHGLPFTCTRVVSDTAVNALPPAFAVAMRPGGGIDIGAMLRSLAVHPSQIPVFVSASANAIGALRRLELLGRLLGPRLGLPDLR